MKLVSEDCDKCSHRSRGSLIPKLYKVGNYRKQFISFHSNKIISLFIKSLQRVQKWLWDENYLFSTV